MRSYNNQKLSRLSLFHALPVIPYINRFPQLLQNR